MGRLVLAALVLAGCASHVASGPAWPKESRGASADDGGESIAPRVVRPIEAAVDKTDDDAKPAPAPAPAPATAPAPVKDAPAAGGAAAGSPAVEDTITTEDIVIEIDD
jgi:hypothetical protein